MPHEIADSDAESDFGSPRRPSISPIDENGVGAQPQSTLDHDPFANLEFDQFLSPTQRLSSAVERLDADQQRLVSSTDNFLRDISQGDRDPTDSTTNTCGLDGLNEQSPPLPPLNKPKRTFSDIEGGHKRAKDNVDFAQRSAKRTKTYGGSRSFMVDGSPLFSDSADLQKSHAHKVVDDKIQSRSETTSNELPVQQLIHPEDIEDSDLVYQAHNRGHNHIYPQQVHTTFLQGNIQNSFMTKSSMGGYSSINLDFRGAGVGLDANANPFGSLSQVSLEGDTNLSQTEGFASLFHRKRRLSDDVPVSENLDLTEFAQRSHFKEMATSPMEKQHSTKGGSSRHTETLEEDLVTRSVSVAVPPIVLSMETNSTEKDNAAKPAPKKRGRKPKTTPVDEGNSNVSINAFEQLQTEDPLDIPGEQYKPRPSRSRAGTVDSTDSHFSQSTHSTGRKGKRSAVPKSAAEPKEQHLSSELNLSDPAMIGVPKEMYVPRPSKSRQKRTFQEDDRDELHDGEHDNPTYVIESYAPGEPHEVTEATPAPATKKKPGKKGKVKRAKTSAAAMLQSAVMYDEDDKDCIFVDEIPVKVKMAPLPQINPVKHELNVEMDNDHQQESEAAEVTGDKFQEMEASSGLKLSVNVPKLDPQEQSEVPAQPPGPKKRGRKPKKKPEIHVEEELSIDEPNNQNTAEQANNNTSASDLNPTKSRPALSSKDPNTTPTPPSPIAPKTLPASEAVTTPSPSPQKPKPIHSPLKPTLVTTSSTSSRTWIKPRVGLSKRTSIPSLLRKLDRSKEPPKTHERKEKLSKRQQEEEDRRRLEAEDAGEEYVEKWDLRGKDGMLLEWDE